MKRENLYSVVGCRNEIKCISINFIQISTRIINCCAHSIVKDLTKCTVNSILPHWIQSKYIHTEFHCLLVLSTFVQLFTLTMNTQLFFHDLLIIVRIQETSLQDLFNNSKMDINPKGISYV